MATNREIIEGWTNDAWNGRNIEAVHDYFQPDFVGHDPYAPEMVGQEAVMQFLSGVHSAFPDFHLQIDDTVEEGDLIACRYTATGTQEGEFMGRPPSGKQLTYGVMAMWRIRDGKICDVWQHWDSLNIANQLNDTCGPDIVLNPGCETGECPVVSDVEQELNKRLIQDWMYGAWNKGRIDLADELIADDCWFWDPSGPPAQGKEQFMQWASGIDAAFPLPHRRLYIDNIIAEGNKTAYRVTLLGKHMGPFAGIPPTGRTINAGALIITEINERKLTRAWQIFDVHRILKQIGVPL